MRDNGVHLTGDGVRHGASRLDKAGSRKTTRCRLIVLQGQYCAVAAVSKYKRVTPGGVVSGLENNRPVGVATLGKQFTEHQTHPGQQFITIETVHRAHAVGFVLYGDRIQNAPLIIVNKELMVTKNVHDDTAMTICRCQRKQGSVQQFVPAPRAHDVRETAALCCCRPVCGLQDCHDAVRCRYCHDVRADFLFRRGQRRGHIMAVPVLAEGNQQLCFDQAGVRNCEGG